MLMKKLTTKQFNIMLRIIDNSNTMDLETFTEALKQVLNIKNQELIDNVVDFLVFQMNITSDASFMDGEENYDSYIKGINRVVEEYKYNLRSDHDGYDFH